MLKKCVVCHDKKSVETARKKFPDAEILFVGSQEPPDDKNLLVMRTLSENIEHLPQFLTFCAWWAISHNKLFLDVDFLAIFEWDAYTKSPIEFWEKINQKLGLDVDAIGLILADKKYYWADTTPVLKTVLKNLNLTPLDSSWYATSNAIISRKKLDEFVSLYETQIETLQDDPKCKWAHERVYASWLNTQKVIPVQGLCHLEANSHSKI